VKYTVIESIVYYAHFCYDCFCADRMPYYYGTEKGVVKPCPVCRSLNVNANFKEQE